MIRKNKPLAFTLTVMILLLAKISFGQSIFYTNFNVSENWTPNSSATTYDTRSYDEGAWNFVGLSSIRDNVDTYDGSNHVFRNRGDFTITNTDEVLNMDGFTIFIRNWSVTSNRDVTISLDGGDNWDVIGTINASWFPNATHFHPFTHDLGELMNFDPGDLIIKIAGVSDNVARMRIGGFMALGLESVVANPTFSPQEGVYFEQINVTISTVTEDAEIYYTLNGDEPTESDILFDTPIEVENDVVIKARAFRDGLTPSDIVEAEFKIRDLLLYKDFQDNNLLSGGWAVYDVKPGANTWHVSTFAGDYFAQITEYQSTPIYPESYLISPKITLSSDYEEAIFSFTNTVSYKTGNALSVKVSPDYSGSGDPSEATWFTLSAVYDDPTGDHGDWTHSGYIDLADYIDNDVYIAFHYLSDASNLGRWRVNDIVLFAKIIHISSDASLSVFNINDINVLGLNGIIVDDPDTDPGATMYVEDFTDFEGIEIVPNHEEAVFEVSLNGIVVEDDFETLAINPDDVIVVEVTAEDETTVKYYKVVIVEDTREITFVKPIGDEVYETGDEVVVEWVSQNIDMLNLYVHYDGYETPVLTFTDINADDGEHSFILPNSAHGIYYFRLAHSIDETFYVESETVEFVDIQAPELFFVYPENEATNVSISTSLLLTFNEAVFSNVGNVVVHKELDDAVFEIVDVASGQVSVSNNEVTVELTSDFEYQTTYYVLIDATAFVDIGENAYEGIDDPATWSFTTEEEYIPQWICNGDFEDWTDGKPDCWFGSKTHTDGLLVNQYSASTQSGSYAVQLVNDEGDHRRFSSHEVDVEEGTTFRINFWARGKGDIRTGLFDDRPGDSYGYSPYNSYISINSSDWKEYTQFVTAANTTNIAEFLFSVVDTDASMDHIQIDNVTIEEGEMEPQWICNGDFEDWTNNKPDCWFGSKTHTDGLVVNQYSASTQSGSFAVQLVNDEGAHRRFSSHNVYVEEGKTYRIDFWVRGKGDIRTGLFDDRPGESWGYGPYNSYISINSSNWANHKQYVTAANTTYIAEFIFSVVDTEADLDHIQIDNVVIEEFEVISDVYNIAELREGATGAEYTLHGEVVLTFQQSYRNQKFVQDATGAILIDDDSDIITTSYDVGDGISNIKGVLASYGGMLQFQPVEDSGPATSIGNPVIAELMTLADIASDDQAKLIRVNDLNFETTGNFSTATVYQINDPSSPTQDVVFRTNFFNADYIGSPIPTNTIDMIALVTEHFGVFQITARSSADFLESNVVLENEKHKVRIFPNPFSNTLSMILNDDVKEIVVFNNLGQKYLKMETNGNELHLNTSDMNAGIYIIRVIMNDGSHFTQKLIKQ